MAGVSKWPGQKQINFGCKYDRDRLVLSGKPKLLIIGHYPSRTESSVGAPFVGLAGKNLLALLMLACPNLFKGGSHPYSRGQKESKTVWSELTGDRIAIFNWRYPERGKKLGSKVVIGKMKSRHFLEEFRKSHDIPVLVLGRAVRTSLVGSSSDVGPCPKDKKIFYWHHPDPRTAAQFWGLKKNWKAFGSLLRFLSEAL